LNIKFYENPLSGSTFVLCRWMDGWMDRQTYRNDKAKSCRSQFYEHA